MNNDQRRARLPRIAACILAAIVAACALGSIWALPRYALTDLEAARHSPSLAFPFGADLLGRSLLPRCLLGGLISITVGCSAAAFSMVLGVAWGSVSGMLGGRIDALLMRIVDILYGLPYLLLVILLKIGLDGLLRRRLGFSAATAELVILLLAIGGVSWLTMARIVRGQVLALRSQAFIEAARATGLTSFEIWRAHLLPNLAGPIVVYAMLTIPQAILQEAFLSFLGIGIQPPLPSWGNLASEGVSAINTVQSFWWLLVFPCALLTTTLLALNILGGELQRSIEQRGRKSDIVTVS